MEPCREGVEGRVVQPLLTDLYQLTMAYAYWVAGRTHEQAEFHLFFRKNPFRGEFTIFAGLSDCLSFLETFRFSASDLAYLRTVLPSCQEEFWQYLATLDTTTLKVSALQEGSVAFPRLPLVKISGPLVLVQLLETVFLNLVNFASLVATNAARFRIAAGYKAKLYEFGLRRAQGPDGGLSASKYSYLGGFDGTSNVLAGKMFGIPVAGTMAHSYISSFTSVDQVQTVCPPPAPGGHEPEQGWLDSCCTWRTKLAATLSILESEANQGEFAAFINYAGAFPASFLALVDTYDVLRSGLLNFCAVALALHSRGYSPLGLRIDSGDLAYLSNKARAALVTVAQAHGVPYFADLEITVSNDINEETILSLNDQEHSIGCYGIGTHLVTCQRQPALGCVYKLVCVAGQPRMKLSQEVEKVTLPGEKEAYRLYGKEGLAILDLLQLPGEPCPRPGEKVLCRHPFLESKRAWVTPMRVEALHGCVWREGRRVGPDPGLGEVRSRVQESLRTLRPDHARSLNPCPYKVSVSEQLYTFIHQLWMESAPIGELS